MIIAESRKAAWAKVRVMEVDFKERVMIAISERWKHWFGMDDFDNIRVVLQVGGWRPSVCLFVFIASQLHATAVIRYTNTDTQRHTHRHTQTHRHAQTHTDTHSHIFTHYVCLFICFIASQHTLCQLRLQQYTTPTVYVSSKIALPSLSLVARITHSVQVVTLPVHNSGLPGTCIPSCFR